MLWILAIINLFLSMLNFLCFYNSHHGSNLIVGIFCGLVGFIIAFQAITWGNRL